MNGNTKQIAARYEIDLDTARKIQDVVECCVGIDWSEATEREINKALDEACELLGTKTTCGCGN